MSFNSQQCCPSRCSEEVLLDCTCWAVSGGGAVGRSSSCYVHDSHQELPFSASALKHKSKFTQLASHVAFFHNFFWLCFSSKLVSQKRSSCPLLNPPPLPSPCPRAKPEAQRNSKTKRGPPSHCREETGGGGREDLGTGRFKLHPSPAQKYWLVVEDKNQMQMPEIWRLNYYIFFFVNSGTVSMGGDTLLTLQGWDPSSEPYQIFWQRN